MRGVYDRITHALIGDQRWPSRASTTAGLQVNGDGTIDVFFGPKAPVGKASIQHVADELLGEGLSN